jgi:hypothetical protein
MYLKSQNNLQFGTEGVSFFPINQQHSYQPCHIISLFSIHSPNYVRHCGFFGYIYFAMYLDIY